MKIQVARKNTAVGKTALGNYAFQIGNSNILRSVKYLTFTLTFVKMQHLVKYSAWNNTLLGKRSTCWSLDPQPRWADTNLLRAYVQDKFLNSLKRA